jgi:hypothetical protein
MASLCFGPHTTEILFVATPRGFVHKNVAPIPGNMRERIIDKCAAMNPQGIE